MNFKQWINEHNHSLAYRYVHKNGQGLMNNNSLDYDRLNDDEYEEVETGYLSLQQPPSSLHNQKVIFAFTPEGEEKHKKLIKLLSKISKVGVVRQQLNLSDYDIVWENNDQLGLKKKEIQKEMAGGDAIVSCKDLNNPNFQVWGSLSNLNCTKNKRSNNKNRKKNLHK